MYNGGLIFIFLNTEYVLVKETNATLHEIAQTYHGFAVISERVFSANHTMRKYLN